MTTSEIPHLNVDPELKALAMRVEVYASRLGALGYLMEKEGKEVSPDMRELFDDLNTILALIEYVAGARDDYKRYNCTAH